MSTHTLTNPSRAPSPPAAAAIAAAATLVTCLPFAAGPAGLAGVLLAAGTVVVGGLATWVAVPQLIVTLVPTLIPSPMFMLTYAWELALIVLAVATTVHGIRSRSTWLWRVGAIERWVGWLVAWGLFSALWSSDQRFFLLGARRSLVAFCALWVASRLPHLASRRWFDVGLIGGASTLALSAIQHSLSTGLSAQQALLHRTEVTNLGWGTANYVATLLLLFSPSVLRLALRSRGLERVLAVVAFALITVVQLIVASRAATVLFLVGTLVQLLRAGRRYRVWVALAALAAIAGLVLSPLGFGLLSRLDNLRELGSMTIRIWYFREGFHRAIEHLPWGMGLSQGYANPDRLKGIDPHNYWLLVGGDLGMPGLILWAGASIAIVRAWWATRVDNASREVAHTMLLTFALAHLHTLVEPTFQGAQYLFLFYWIVCGTLAYAAGGPGRSAHTWSANPNRSQNTPPGT